MQHDTNLQAYFKFVTTSRAVLLGAIGGVFDEIRVQHDTNKQAYVLICDNQQSWFIRSHWWCGNSAFDEVKEQHDTNQQAYL